MLFFSDKINIFTHAFNQCSEVVVVTSNNDEYTGKVVSLTNEQVEINESGTVIPIQLSDITQIFS